jgi:hypothetical protein
VNVVHFPEDLVSQDEERNSSVTSPGEPSSAWPTDNMYRSDNLSLRSRRTSRASSIVSTWTKASIRTMEEDRYSNYSEGEGVGSEDDSLGRQPSVTIIDDSRGSIGSTTRPSAARTPHHAEPFPLLKGSGEDASLLVSTTSAVARTPSFTPGKENLSVQRRHNRSASAHNVSAFTTHGDRPATMLSPSSPIATLKRHGGLRIVTSRTASGHTVNTPSASGASSSGSRQALSASAIDQESEPTSATYIGESARGWFPPTTGKLQGYGYGKVRIIEDKMLRHPDLALQSKLPDRPNTIDVGPGPTTTPTIRTSRESHERPSLDYTQSEPGPSQRPLAVPLSPASIDEHTVGTKPPPSMDTENDVSIHYSRIVRSIDKEHREELRKRDRQLRETHDMLNNLEVTVFELRSELMRTKSQVRGLTDPNALQRLVEESTVEARNFAMPPLKLNHIRTLKMALKRRAERLKKFSHDSIEGIKNASVDLGGNITGQEQVHSPLHLHDAFPATAIVPVPEAGKDYKMAFLEAEVKRLSQSKAFWADRYEDLHQHVQELSVSSKEAGMQRGREEAAESVREEANREWEGKWEEKNRHLLERMRRLDENSNARVEREIEKAIKQRDESWEVMWKGERDRMVRRVRELEAKIESNRSDSIMSPRSEQAQEAANMMMARAHATVRRTRAQDTEALRQSVEAISLNPRQNQKENVVQSLERGVADMSI